MKDSNKKLLRILVIFLELLAVSIIIYIIALPFYPLVKYKLSYEKQESIAILSIATSSFSKVLEKVKEETVEIKNRLPQAEYDVSPNRVIIPKIGVNAPIVESNNMEYGLSRGAWRIPESSTPDKGGNTVITGHRFKYLPPNNLTFYLFHKLELGDVFSVLWDKEDYYYLIKDIKIVDKTELSILNPTDKSIVTLFTCHPIYSTKQRLVVIGELIEG